MCTLANFGNAATRIADVVVSDGTYARGADPDVEALFKQQARETDKKKREALLHQIQQLVYDRVRFGPLYEFIWPSGIGPRVAEPGLMLIDPYPWSAPLEVVRLKPRP
jgi:ABC-type transport system substrate-binding protein